MKTTTITTLLAALMTVSAQADGFICKTQNSELNIKVYNNTDPNIGTRVPAIMVVSDPSIASNNKTIAVFKDTNHTLSYEGYGVYEAKVDLRFNDSGRQGENIAGTKLGQLKTIRLSIDFDYASAADISKNQSLLAVVDYQKRNGEELTENAVCERYKKGD
jgi:hypothetical protein